MRRKNFTLLEEMWKQRINQCDLVKLANLSSEARLSRIINRLVEPTSLEIKHICRVLGCSQEQLGLNLTANGRSQIVASEEQ